MQISDKDIDKLLKAYSVYKTKQREYKDLEETLTTDLAIGKYISKKGMINKLEGYSRIIDKEKLLQDYPELDLTKYEKITPYTTVKVKVNS